MRKALISILSLLVCTNLYAAACSYDNTFVANDVYSSDFHTRLNENFTCVGNSANNVTTSQVTNDTLTEADMADEINPRVRTYEGAICEFVYTGFTIASGGSLTQNISTGTGYPRGYRIIKSSNTAKTFSASKWTFVDLDQSGDFQYSEVAIGGATPTTATNSIRIARVSTDSSAVVSVLDLAIRTCATASFDNLRNATTDPTLLDILEVGSPVKTHGADGFIQGVHVSWDSATQFAVTSGAVLINGRPRVNSSVTLVPQTNDDPTAGVSGLDTGSIATSTAYCIYAVSDELDASDFSVSFSTNCTTPNGVSNYRKIGKIATDAGSRFTSGDALSVNGVDQKELVGAWAYISPSGTVLNSFNVGSVTRHAAGSYTVNWRNAFLNASYGISVALSDEGSNVRQTSAFPSASGAYVTVRDGGPNLIDPTRPFSIKAAGDRRT